MNYEHIRSVFRGNPNYTGEVDGRRIVSNGWIALPFHVDLGCPASQWKPIDGVARVWTKALASSCIPATVGDCVGKGEHDYQRKIGDSCIAERLFRCFGEGVTWTLPTHPKDPLLAHCNGELVGVVMPMLHCSETEACNPTDSEVFGPHASADNDWYLIDRDTLKKRISHAVREKGIAEDRIEELEGEVEEWEKEIRSLRERLMAVVA
jgi:hypothetical protein